MRVGFFVIYSPSGGARNLVSSFSGGAKRLARSTLTTEYLNKALQQSGLESAYRVLSRGTQGTGGEEPPKHKNLRDYENEWLLTKPVLEEIGITIPVDQVATPIDARIVEEAALILAMEEGVLLTSQNSLVRQFPSMRFKMKLFTELEGVSDDINDLYGQKDSVVVRREILRIDTIVKTRVNKIIAPAEILTIQKEREV